jgi:sigma-54 dependent transcriptional regulator, acetoin dehydrogenase operon transcriptional activator AcoR
MFAQAIHNYTSPGQPFVALNCSAIPQTLIESELFGYEDGAFTGASKNGRPGKFELANGGTIFLDEIGEMPLNTQVSLLRVLQERCVQRIGGIRTIPIDVRVIAATNKNLAEEVKKGTFRNDLYYRLNVFQIEIPPLRERKSDIAVLVDYFINHIALRFGKSVESISPSAMAIMQSYSWPGNVRQLENCIERAVNFAEDGHIDEYYLTEYIQKEMLKNTNNVVMGENELTNLHDIEMNTMIVALNHFGERKKAAEALGISRSTLYRKLKSFGLEGRF